MVPSLEAGVVDPTKVIRLALLNAVSAATVLLSTDCLITEVKEEKEQGAPDMGPYT